jgi:BASS family bile acid:Na+ symporter
MLQDIAIKTLVVAMMIAIGLDLPLVDLRHGLRQRWLLGVALVVNLVVIPGLVFGVAAAIALPSALATGLLICAVAPGGPTGPLFTRIANADLGLATSLQVLLSFIALITAPLSLELLGGGGGGDGGGQESEGSLIWPMVSTLAVYQLLPLAAGMAVRAKRAPLAKRLAKPMGLLANVLLLVVIIGLIATRGRILFEQGPSLHMSVCAFVLLPLVIAWLWPVQVRASLLAVGFVTTVRNLSIALMLSASFYEDPAVDAAILVWGFYMMVLPALLAWRLGARAPGVTGLEGRGAATG